jgi:hypothetical protein
MPNVNEFNKKIEISIGAIAFIIAITFSATKIYSSLTTMETRMDKRYQRHEQHFEMLDERVNNLEIRFNDHEKCPDR